MKAKSCVIIGRALQMDYLQDYVQLPANYGSPEYFSRPDVAAIRQTVHGALHELDIRTGFSETLADRRVFIKPNLVSVYHNLGLKETEYPESTDPRVMDAVISFFYQYTRDIIIIESSGKGMPTRLSFRLSGLDRVARYYGIRCVALELEPVTRYILPKAEVMKEVYLPSIMDEVVQGNAFYVSVPKMKTNLYTGVTLGFKNAMGILPYNLRMRNHNHMLDKKLADLLYLIEADLTIIDGIIGGEGNTPAPVDPVHSNVIICGNNTVETDRCATRLMGINPTDIKLIKEADNRGFNDEDVEIIGDQKVIPFRRANPSLIDNEFTRDFPNVITLIGFSGHGLPEINDLAQVTPELVQQMESICAGGCFAAAKTAFEVMKYSQGLDRNFSFTMILGWGTRVNGDVWYFDKLGKAYSLETIQTLPGKKLTLGECTSKLKPYCDVNGEGCSSHTSTMISIFKAAEREIPFLSVKNKHLLSVAWETIRIYLVKLGLMLHGAWVDCPYDTRDIIYPIPALSEDQLRENWLILQLPSLQGKTLWREIRSMKIL